MKVAVKDLEKGLDFTNAEVDELKDKMDEESDKRNNLEQHIKKLGELEVRSLSKNLEQEREKLINLEQYTRKKNLIFNQLSEKPREDCKALIFELLDQAGVETDEMKFHAVHRVGRKK